MRRHLMVTAAALALFGSAAGWHWIYAKERAKPAAAAPSAPPLSENIKKGLAWLVAHQQPSGGWGQGEESQHMGQGMAPLKDTANVADTCMATLALLRAGSTSVQGPYRDNVRRSLDFLCREVEQSDATSLYVTQTRGTRVQGKLGTYIDTFLSALVLAEVRNQMPEGAEKRRVMTALDKVMRKIEKNQRPDGTWDNVGWAPVLAQGMAAKALNRAAQEGARVDEAVRERVEKNARNQINPSTGRAVVAADSAGVALYSSAATLGALQDSANTNAELAKDLKRQVAALPASAGRRAAAEAKLKVIEENERDLERARGSVINRLDDRQFMAGFGSNGGEEFLSYLNIGESLVIKAGAEWQKWERSMNENLSRIQNNDGSWSGHHCITGRTFCTAAALMVLTIDRATQPVAAKIRRS